MAQLIADPDGAAMRDARDAALRGDAEAVAAWLTTPLSQSEFNRQWILKHVCFGTGGPGSPACVRLLLEAGAVATHRDLLNAIFRGNADVVRLLVAESTINVNRRDACFTPLHRVANGGGHPMLQNPIGAPLPELVDILCDAGADPNARGARNLAQQWGGITPLMIAAQNHLAGPDSVQLLLRHGADVNAQDDDGRRVLDFARSGSREVERLVTDVYLAGSFKRYLNAPRRELLGLRTLIARGRAAPKEPCHFHARLFGSRLSLPDHLFWKILSFWASSRDL